VNLAISRQIFIKWNASALLVGLGRRQRQGKKI
jgi:hypothetical protein